MTIAKLQGYQVYLSARNEYGIEQVRVLLNSNISTATEAETKVEQYCKHPITSFAVVQAVKAICNHNPKLMIVFQKELVS